MASLKNKQLNLLFQSFYAFGQRISVLLPKTKFKLYGGVDYLSLCISFNLALFFTAVISWFYFITFGTWHSSIWKCIYSGKKETPTKLLEFWRTLFIIWYLTVNILCSSKTLLLHSYPGVAALDNAFIFLFISTSPYLFYFSPFSVSPPLFYSPVCLSSFLFSASCLSCFI